MRYYVSEETIREDLEAYRRRKAEEDRRAELAKTWAPDEETREEISSLRHKLKLLWARGEKP